MKYLIAFVIGIALAAFYQTDKVYASEATCTDIHGVQVSRLNPTSISDYQACWLDTHRADVQAGTIGSLFWARNVDGSYFSIPTNTLASMGNNKAVVDYVSMAMFNAVTSNVTSLSAELADAEMMIAFLNDKRKAKNARISNLKDRLDNLRDRRDVLKSKLADATNRISTFMASSSTAPSVATPTAPSSMSARQDYYNSRPETLNRMNNVVQKGDYENQGHVRDILIGDAITDAANPWWVEVRAEIKQFVRVETAKAFTAGFNQGYDQGYQDGYADGYAQGYADAKSAL